MRILIVNTFYYPNMQGGAEQSVKLLAEGLVRAGHVVGIYCTDLRNGEQKKTQIINGVLVYRCSSHKLNLFRFSYEKEKIGRFERLHQKIITVYNTSIQEDFFSVCKDFQPEVIHTNTVYGMSFLVWKYAKKIGLPVIHTVRDTAIVSPVSYEHKSNCIVKIIYRAYMRWITSFVDGLTAPSTFKLNETIATGCFRKTKVKECIYNAVMINNDQLYKDIQQKEIRVSKVIKFIYAGRLLESKGIQHMLEAFFSIADENIKLIICGDGPLKKMVETAAEKDQRISYYGKLIYEKLVEKYNEADVLLVPSIWEEPFGRTVIEGNLCGLPVIAGNVGGIPEIVDNIGGGIVYEAGNAQQLAAKMVAFSNRENNLKYLSNIKKSIWKYDVDNQIDHFIKCYNQILC